MRQFYLIFKDEKWHTLCAKLTWSHYRQLIWFNDMNKILYYINISENQNLSVRELQNRIKSNEYERLDNKTKTKLKTDNQLEVQDLIKNPIVLNNNSNKEIIKEKALKQLILEDMDNFLE